MNPSLTRAREYLKRNFILVLFVLLIVLFAVGYVLGFRPGPGFTFVRAGTLVIQNLPEGATVYADETKRAVGHGKDVRIALIPGNHSIIVDVKGDNPWNDIVTVAPRVDTTIRPLLIPLTVDRNSFEKDARAAADKSLAAYKLPTAAEPLVLENGCALVSVSQNRIVANAATSTACTTPPPYLCVGGTCATTVIFSPIATLRSVIPFPGREDAVIVAYGDTLAVLELNPLKPQFFAPLVRGVSPIAAPMDDHDIIVHDDNRTFSIAL